MRSRTCGVVFSLIILAFGSQSAIAVPPPEHPNIVFILIDDMGATDVGCYGSTFYETPNIDRFATQGMKFTQAYAACCVCSPTRAALLTGKSPARLHLTDWIPGHVRPKAKLKVPDFHDELPLEETTLPEALKASGYVSASIGKWHLGGPDFYPEKHGFDLNIAGTAKGQPPSYFSPYKIATLPDGPAGEYITDRLTTEAEKFIETNKDRPFFLYFPHFAVHTPLQGKKDVIAKYKAKTVTGEQKNPIYASMVESSDDSVGRIMKKLDELKLTEKTIVVFTSDNGGLIGPTSNAPLRAGKGTLYEGGIREPLIIRYPPMIQPGSTCAAPVITTDFFTTLVELTGTKLAKPAPTDGVSIVPLLTQTKEWKRDTLAWHYPHYHPGGATPSAAMRQGDWKIIRYFEDGREELFNLATDPSEKKDVSATEPDALKRVGAALTAWLKETDAQMPTANPNWEKGK